MAPPRSGRLGNMAAMARLLGKLPPKEQAELERLEPKRGKLASFCRMLGAEFSNPKLSAPGGMLTPRLQQTLQRLLAGDSEKQTASALRLSQHTVHVYVKSLYRHYQVNSRGELL